VGNRKKPAQGFQERTTMMSPLGITIEENGGPKTPLTKHHVGSDHAPTVAEALDMGRALFDAIATEQAKAARESANTESPR
jgi:hypothetical protein